MSGLDERSKLKGYATYTLGGVVVSGLLALFSYQDGVAEGHYGWSREGLSEMLGIAVIGGAVAGPVAFALRRITSRGAWAEYMRWIVAVTIALVLVLLPAAVAQRSLSPLFLAGFLGLCGGASLAAVVRSVR